MLFPHNSKLRFDLGSTQATGVNPNKRIAFPKLFTQRFPFEVFFNRTQFPEAAIVSLLK